MKFFSFLLLVLSLHSCQSQRTLNGHTEEDKEFWYDDGQLDLMKALNLPRNLNIAKNVILFLGDGLSLPTLTASRILKGQLKGQYGEEEWLNFEKFPNVGLLKTYNIDRQVPDSAATAAAFLSGSKTKYEMVGVSGKAKLYDCESTLDESVRLKSVAHWAQQEGKDVGVVTTTRLGHATPASLYAHAAHRSWECDTKMKEADKPCKDIARQLVEDVPGAHFKVILGGGRQTFQANPGNSSTDPISKHACRRGDDRDLIQEWLKSKRQLGYRPTFVENARQLNSVNPAMTDYLIGAFTNHHLPFEYVRRKQADPLAPHIKEMTAKAIQILQKNDKGYFLLVEGGRIDHAHHKGMSLVALQETLAMEEAVQVALDMTKREETLIIVTSDHSHVMTMNGYPKRGNPIAGLADVSDIDNLPYTTLMYTTGPGYNYTVKDDHVTRWNLSGVNTRDEEFLVQAAVPRIEESHGGEDVIVYATGPMSHLFHGLHEQTYVAHVMSYAACMGPQKHMCVDQHRISAAPTLSTRDTFLILFALQLLYFCLL